jgi:hypothetical protein
MPEVAPSGGMSMTRERIKCLEAGCHVSGSFWEYQANPNPNIKRRVHERIYILFLLLIERNTKFVGMMGKDQSFL